MSRSGYCDEIDDQWAHICWRGAVASAIRGARGQALLREMLAAFDAMPVKELVAHELEANGAHCALGVVGANRSLDLSAVDPDEPTQVARLFGIAPAMAQEIVYMNDEAQSYHDDEQGNWRHETPSERWSRMREWVASQIKQETPA